MDNSILGIVLMNVLALALVIGRAIAFRTRLYRPMLLNIGLSVAPVFILAMAALGTGLLIAAGVPHAVGLTVGAAALVVWLLMLPNAGYLITELNLSHRVAGDGVPQWYDILLVLSLAMSGVLNTLFNIFLVQLIYVSFRSNDIADMTGTEVRVLTAMILLLVAFGIYLGRHLRFNSWDVIRPWRLIGKIFTHLRTPSNAIAAGAFTVLAAAFFGLMYLVVISPVVAYAVGLSAS